VVAAQTAASTEILPEALVLEPRPRLPQPTSQADAVPQEFARASQRVLVLPRGTGVVAWEALREPGPELRLRVLCV
jgi:hypothetical protein